MRMGLVVSCGIILGWANYLGHVKGVYMWMSRIQLILDRIGRGWLAKEKNALLYYTHNDEWISCCALSVLVYTRIQSNIIGRFC